MLSSADLCYSVYSLFSALIMHVYQMRSSIPSIVTATQERMHVCMNALKEVSKVWLVAKMVHTLFESILGNKVLEERLQKAAGKRHNKAKQAPAPIPKKDETSKRKYDDMELGFANGPPAPQVSYERSRPQTPAVTPSREMAYTQGVPPMGAPFTTSPHLRQQSDTLMGATGNSHTNTRPPTPFNTSYSIPTTPPDLFLVTRNSPTISQTLWESFQPDQLFPEGTNMSGAQMQIPSTLDPQLANQQLMPQMQNANMYQQTALSAQGQPTHLQQRTLSAHNVGSPPQGIHGASFTHTQEPPPQQNPAHAWPTQFDAPIENAKSSDDSWSNSSTGQPAVPTTLNVEDW